MSATWSPFTGRFSTVGLAVVVRGQGDLDAPALSGEAVIPSLLMLLPAKPRRPRLSSAD
jgi:hypothetical protein